MDVEPAFISPEILNTQKTQVIFGGYTHDHFNLQGAERLGNLVEQKCAEVDGPVVVFIEAAGVNLERSGGIKYEMETFGTDIFWMFQTVKKELGREPTLEEVQARVDSINRNGVINAVRRKELPLDTMAQYSLYHKIGEMVEKEGVEIIVENQEDELLVQNNNLMYEVRKRSESLNQAWKEKRVDDAISMNFEGVIDTISLTENRNPQWKKDVVTQIESLTGDDRKSAIIVIGGTNHYGVLCDIRDEVGDNSGVKFELHPEGDWHSPSTQLFELLRNGTPPKEIPEELKVKALFEYMVGSSLRQRVSPRTMDDYAKHYEDIQKVISRIANTITYDDLNKYCQQGIDMGFAIRSHPLAESVKYFLP